MFLIDELARLFHSKPQHRSAKSMQLKYIILCMCVFVIFFLGDSKMLACSKLHISSFMALALLLAYFSIFGREAPVSSDLLRIID